MPRLIKKLAVACLFKKKKKKRSTNELFFCLPDPHAWSRTDVSKWLRWTMQQNRIQPTPANQATVERWAELGGPGFAMLAEQEFRQKFPQVRKFKFRQASLKIWEFTCLLRTPPPRFLKEGELMYAQLDIWRSTAAYLTSSSSAISSAAAEDVKPGAPSTMAQQQPQAGPASSASSSSSSSHHKPAQKEDSFDISYVLQMLDSKDDAAIATAAAAAATTTTTATSFLPAVTTSSCGGILQQQMAFSAVTTTSSSSSSSSSQLLSPPPPPPPYPSFESASAGLAATIKQEFAEPMEEDDEEEGERGDK